VPAVVNAVYKKLFSFDITKNVFLKRNEGFHGSLAADSEHLTQDSEQIKFRKDMLSKYLTKLVTAEYDAKFVKYLDHVGKIHTPKGGSKSINVEYIHCNALMGYVEDILINAVLEHKDVDMPTKVKLVRALNKLLWVQMDLFARYYVNDGEDITGPTSVPASTNASPLTTQPWVITSAAVVMTSIATFIASRHLIHNI
jgi:hypothetical protein